MIDRDAARDFLTTHARVLDRRRFALLEGEGGAEGVFAALAAHRNADGGYGWAIEPDLRAPSSQPAGALHAFEAMAECGPATTGAAVALCDWLATATLPDGGLPFAAAGAAGPGTAPFWAEADHGASSLHITAAVCAQALAVAAHDPAVAGHPWLATAVEYCWAAVGEERRAFATLELRFVLGFLDALAGGRDGVADRVARLMEAIPASGVRAVEGGIEGESMRPLDWSPRPGGPTREHLDPAAVAGHLDELEAAQEDDGGWRVDFATRSPAAALDWRGYRTVEVVALLAANGRLD